VVFNLISAAGTVLALVLSVVALYRQRATPRFEGQLVVIHPTRLASISIRNSGTATARAPWFMFAAQGQYVIGQVGSGFLGPNDERSVPTDLAMPEKIVPGEIKGVVGYLDANGRHVVWSTIKGKRKRFKTTTYEEASRGGLWATARRNRTS
jgi:hypothetical protein